MSKNNITNCNNRLDHNTQPQICEKYIWVRSFIFFIIFLFLRILSIFNIHKEKENNVLKKLKVVYIKKKKLTLKYTVQTLIIIRTINICQEIISWLLGSFFAGPHFACE